MKTIITALLFTGALSAAFAFNNHFGATAEPLKRCESIVSQDYKLALNRNTATITTERCKAVILIEYDADGQVLSMLPDTEIDREMLSDIAYQINMGAVQ